MPDHRGCHTASLKNSLQLIWKFSEVLSEPQIGATWLGAVLFLRELSQAMSGLVSQLKMSLGDTWRQIHNVSTRGASDGKASVSNSHFISASPRSSFQSRMRSYSGVFMMYLCTDTSIRTYHFLCISWSLLCSLFESSSHGQRGVAEELTRIKSCKIRCIF